MAERKNEIAIENAKIILRNFSGKQSAYNNAGNRNFCLVIKDEEAAMQLKNQGWNVKMRQFDDPDEPVMYYIQVKVSYANVPPTVWLVSDSAKPVLLNDSTIGQLDFVDLENVDLVISAYHWEMSGKSGVKAYLKSGYFTIHEDPFRKKYAKQLYGDDSDTMDDDAEEEPWS